jgi:hypothetical protein
MIILGHYKLLINSELLTALLPIFGGRAAMWVNRVVMSHKIIGFQNTSSNVEHFYNL